MTKIDQLSKHWQSHVIDVDTERYLRPHDSDREEKQ